MVKTEELVGKLCRRLQFSISREVYILSM